MCLDVFVKVVQTYNPLWYGPGTMYCTTVPCGCIFLCMDLVGIKSLRPGQHDVYQPPINYRYVSGRFLDGW